MRFFTPAHLLLVALPIAAQDCTDGTPRITGLSVPDTIPGDNTEQQGEMSFVDDDAGVRYAHLENLICPEGFVCPELTLDLWIEAPEVGEANAGTIGFYLSCNNPTSTSGYIAYLWTLEDIDANVSEPFSFDFDCVGTGTGRGTGGVEIAAGAR